MPEEDAKALLLRIAPRIGDVADEIAHLCGCLPLALRLAGSALTERLDLSPSKYAQRLKEGKEKFGGVNASLGLSYELLSEERRQLWRVLAVFSGSFNAKATSAVWKMEADSTRDVLWELVRSSLIEWEEKDGRYKLHDLVRHFLSEKIMPAEQAVAQKAHSEYYLMQLGQADKLYQSAGEESRLGLRLLDLEWNNIRTGQIRAVMLFQKNHEAAGLCNSYPDFGAYCLDLRQNPTERVKWREAALPAAQYLKDHEAEAAHLTALGNAYRELGNPRYSIDLHEQALVIHRKLNNLQGESANLTSLGLAYLALGEAQRAVEFYDLALPIVLEIGDQQGECAVLCGLGNAHIVLEDFKGAISSYEQALGIGKKISNRSIEGKIAGNIGRAYWSAGEPQHAIGFLEQSMKISREIGDRQAEANAAWNLGSISLEKGDIAGTGLMQILVDYKREIGHPDAERDAAHIEALRARIENAARD